MKLYKKFYFAGLLLLLLLFLISCTPAQRPAPSQPEKRNAEQQDEEDIPKPAIPERISQGADKEPVLKVYDVEKGKIVELPFEQYLEAVVAGEMKNDWPSAALEAQAIIARTFALQFIAEKGGSRHEGADVSTDIEEAQAWNPEAVNDNIKTAISKTRGMVMVYEGKFANAWFHSNAGGITASAKEGLNFKEAEPPYIKVVKSPDTTGAPADEMNWTATFTREEIRKAAKDAGQEVKSVNSVTVGRKGPSGRAMTLVIDGVEVSAPELRIALGSMKMKSTLLTDLRVEGDQVVMKGKGYGHGVGMSQWGAYNMANQGKTAVDIIKYYYKDIRLVRLWN